MTAGYIIGFVDAAGMVDPATLPFLMSFYNQASAAVTWHAMQWKDGILSKTRKHLVCHNCAWNGASHHELLQTR
jgi:hypothetical protein